MPKADSEASEESLGRSMRNLVIVIHVRMVRAYSLRNHEPIKPSLLVLNRSIGPIAWTPRQQAISASWSQNTL